MKAFLNVFFLVFLGVGLAACDPLYPLMLAFRPALSASAQKTLLEFPGPVLRPVSKNDPTCPDLNGNYRNPKGSPYSFFPKTKNQNEMSVREEILRGEPIQRGGGIGGTYYYHETKEFEEQAIWEFEQRDKTLTVTLMDAGWAPYKRMTYGLDHPMIGCHDGTLYVRTTYLSYAQGVYSGAWSSELQVRKLSNGDLEIKENIRHWVFSYYRGLLGYDPVTKEPGGGTEPWIREFKLVFSVTKRAG
jgi:hypothetical protein